VVNYLAGATSSLSAITVAWVAAAGAVVNPNFLGYVPKCVLGGLLFYLGANLLYRWLVDSARRLPLLEYLSLLAIALIIVLWEFVAGLLIGGCHRLRHLRAQCKPDPRNQIQLRWIGVSFFARSGARGVPGSI